MTEIKNIAGKLVCKINEANRTVEIVSKGFWTIVVFLANGEIEIFNGKLEM